MDPIKKHLVTQYLPPGWQDDGKRFDALRKQSTFAPLLQLPDPDDVHVALAAADWAKSSGTSVVLTTDNLKNFPGEVLLPFDINPLHPGDVLDLVALLDADGLSKSLQKTTTDFKNPQFELVVMLVSILSAQQFDNVELATKLQARWGLGLSRV